MLLQIDERENQLLLEVLGSAMQRLREIDTAGMQLEVVRDTGRRWVLRPVGGAPSKKRGLREGLWTLSTEQINATCRLVRGVD